MTGTMYEIRKDGRVWVRSPLPDCGYTPETMKSLRAHGFRVHTVKGSTDKKKKEGQ